MELLHCCLQIVSQHSHACVALNPSRPRKDGNLLSQRELRFKRSIFVLERNTP